MYSYGLSKLSIYLLYQTLTFEMRDACMQLLRQIVIATTWMAWCAATRDASIFFDMSLEKILHDHVKRMLLSPIAPWRYVRTYDTNSDRRRGKEKKCREESLLKISLMSISSVGIELVVVHVSC